MFPFLLAALAFVLVTKRLVGEAASAVRLGDGLLFRGSEGVSEPWLKMFPQMLECALFCHFSLFGLLVVAIFPIPYFYQPRIC